MYDYYFLEPTAVVCSFNLRVQNVLAPKCSSLFLHLVQLVTSRQSVFYCGLEIAIVSHDAGCIPPRILQ